MIVRSYIFEDKTANLIDQLALVENRPKTEIVENSIDLYDAIHQIVSSVRVEDRQTFRSHVILD